MSGTFPVNDKAIPALTPRFLLVLDDGKDLLELKPKPKGRNKATTTKLEESKEHEESLVLFAPYTTGRDGNESNGKAMFKNCSPVWSSLPSFDNIPIPPCSMPDPSTPQQARATMNLFASFSSSPISRDGANMWQYNSKNKFCHPLLSPRTTDAVGGENARKTAEALWKSPRTSKKHFGINIQQKSVAIPSVFPPIAPSLLVDDAPGNKQTRTKDRPPSIIVFMARTYDKDNYGDQCLGAGSYDNCDEVSLLADDPDEDDEGVLPPSTYDVVVNILDEIDRDDNEKGVGDNRIE